MQQLPIGYDSFVEIRNRQLKFVDKSLFIQEIFDDAAKISLITRPRRFGKTLNLSMLHCFLAAEVYGETTEGLFDDLKISHLGDKYMHHQGQYPVIFITFKDVKDHSFMTAMEALAELIRRLYQEHRSVLTGDTLAREEKELYHRILRKQGSEVELTAALRNLMEYMTRHHGVKPWLLIDEYDTPIQSSFLHGYYEEMISLMRHLLGAALKTNPYLNKAVITGILRIAKESLFSGLNNIEVHTLLSSKYGEYFGFTEVEVAALLQEANLQAQADNIRRWYNGYLVGDIVIYNPWSIVHCIRQQGALSPYWVNTSDNALIKRLLAHADIGIKARFEGILTGKTITALIDENVVFGDLGHSENSIWSLLLFAGYLKALRCRPSGALLEVELTPPNYEVSLLYETVVQGWFIDSVGPDAYQAFLTSLIRGDVEEFRLRLEDCLLNALSVFDVTGQHPEKFYHGFVMGLIISLTKTHQVQSNRESGFGRYDVMLIPNNKQQLGIIIEFKTVRGEHQDLQIAAQEALTQINDRRYDQSLYAQGIRRILKLGLAFRGKSVAMLAVSENQ